MKRKHKKTTNKANDIKSLSDVDHQSVVQPSGVTVAATTAEAYHGFITLFEDGKLIDPSTHNLAELRLIKGLFTHLYPYNPYYRSKKQRLDLATKYLDNANYFSDPDELMLLIDLLADPKKFDPPGPMYMYTSSVTYYASFLAHFDSYKKYLPNVLAEIPKTPRQFVLERFTMEIFDVDDRFFDVEELRQDEDGKVVDKMIEVPKGGLNYSTMEITRDRIFPYPINHFKLELGNIEETDIFNMDVFLSYPYAVAIFPHQDPAPLEAMILDGNVNVKSVIINKKLTVEVLIKVNAKDQKQWKEEAAMLDYEFRKQGLVTQSLDLKTPAHCPDSINHLIYFNRDC